MFVHLSIDVLQQDNELLSQAVYIHWLPSNVAVVQEEVSIEELHVAVSIHCSIVNDAVIQHRSVEQTVCPIVVDFYRLNVSYPILDQSIKTNLNRTKSY
jgi:hypothetical protein